MPVIATYAQLRDWGKEANAQRLLKEAAVQASAADRLQRTVFLSHSTKDDDLVAGVVQVLEIHGGRAYVDHFDPSIAGSDCLAIAERLRLAIKGCRKFVLLASPRSKDSTWIPWELGLGDGLQTANNVALFPSAETMLDMEWANREYLGLYRRVVWGPHANYDKNVWMVWNHRDNTAQELRAWLTS